MSRSESRSHFKPKCILIVLAALCLAFVVLATRSFANNFERQRGGMAGTPQLLALNDSEGGVLSSVVEEGWPAVDFDPHGKDTLVVLHTQKTGGSNFVKHLVTLQKNGQYLCSLSQAVRKSIKTRGRIPRQPQQRQQKQRRQQRKQQKARGIRIRRQQQQQTKHAMTSCPRDPAHPQGAQWMIASKTVRWVCGIHASYNEYRNCLPSLKGNPRISLSEGQRLHYVILLRHPVLRYLSEYLHFQRNATWANARHVCDHRPVTPWEMPPCYPGFYAGQPWVNVTLSAFVGCDSNWGNNRQTMMLADLEAVHCYNVSALSKEERDRRLLESAKANLREFSFFGMTEYMEESCVLFERTFGMEFAARLEPYDSLDEFRSGPLLVNLQGSSSSSSGGKSGNGSDDKNLELYRGVLERNRLDMQLYAYALELFAERARRVGVEVNRDYVAEEVEKLRAQPRKMDQAMARNRNLNYKVS